MALKKSNIRVTVSIDGIDLTYNATQSEAELFQKAEELINKEIDTFRKTYHSTEYNAYFADGEVRYGFIEERKRRGRYRVFYKGNQFSAC